MDSSTNFVDVKNCDSCQKRFTSPLEADHPNWLPVSFWKKQGIEVGELKRCAACKIAKYCSKACQATHWKEHKKVCVPINDAPSSAGGAGRTGGPANEEDLSIRKEILRQLDEQVDKGSDEYKDVARRELRIFRESYGRSYERMAFPDLFFMGRGFFDDDDKGTIRFKDYRHFLMCQFTGQFKDHHIWPGWAKQCEKDLRSAVAAEIATERYRAENPG